MTTEGVNAIKRKGDEAFVKGGQESEAIEHYTNALDLAKDLKGYDDRQRSKMYSARAECYLRTQQYEKAIGDCNESLKYDRDNFKSQFRRAKAYAQLNQIGAAITDLKIVVQKDNENTQAKELLKELEAKQKPEETSKLVSQSTAITSGATEDTFVRKSKRFDPDIDVSKDDLVKICDYNILNKKKIELEDEISLLTVLFGHNKKTFLVLFFQKEITQLEAAESMIDMLLDDNAVRLQVGTTSFFITNEASDEFAKQTLKRFKARRAAFTQELDEAIEEMKRQRAFLKAKFKDKIGLPEIEKTENTGSEY
ncbi:hypothetical protein RFI_28305 [Reticulomyxa filosa]|uniref:Uncharacterized protein n=1 Tax=Reticulomyxa filosa TaxID=46433 RepID=X6M521_RETFI|nr:hypothetical protein RFI_28305 [Reticulomyxa filosa]|eukprot:ETO09083.1 hypothetical protein RFI_28305 [Reticulomyxa filosa]